MTLRAAIVPLVFAAAAGLTDSWAFLRVVEAFEGPCGGFVREIGRGEIDTTLAPSANFDCTRTANQLTLEVGFAALLTTLGFISARELQSAHQGSPEVSL